MLCGNLTGEEIQKRGVISVCVYTYKCMCVHVYTVHGVLNARILKWFAIPFFSGPHSVRPFHHDPPVLHGPTWHGLVSLS